MCKEYGDGGSRLYHFRKQAKESLFWIPTWIYRTKQSMAIRV